MIIIIIIIIITQSFTCSNQGYLGQHNKSLWYIESISKQSVYITSCT